MKRLVITAIVIGVTIANVLRIILAYFKMLRVYLGRKIL